MSMTAMMGTSINYDYRAGGEVLCKNPKGLIFFLRAEPPAHRPAAPPPAPRSWQPVEATREVDVRRHAEPQAMQAINEASRAVPAAEPYATFKAVEATHEVEVRRAAEPPAVSRATGPLPEAPAPGKNAQGGWFGKLFGK